MSSTQFVAEGGDGSKNTGCNKCRKCGETFPSGNKLFRHIYSNTCTPTSPPKLAPYLPALPVSPISSTLIAPPKPAPYLPASTTTTSTDDHILAVLSELFREAREDREARRQPHRPQPSTLTTAESTIPLTSLLIANNPTDSPTDSFLVDGSQSTFFSRQQQLYRQPCQQPYISRTYLDVSSDDEPDVKSDVDLDVEPDNPNVETDDLDDADDLDSDDHTIDDSGTDSPNNWDDEYDEYEDFDNGDMDEYDDGDSE